MGGSLGGRVDQTGHTSFYVWIRDVLAKAMPQTLEMQERRFNALLASAPQPIHPQLKARVESTAGALRVARERANRIEPLARAMHADMINAIENGRPGEEKADVGAAYREMGAK
jgi:hypothetical protein